MFKTEVLVRLGDSFRAIEVEADDFVFEEISQGSSEKQDLSDELRRDFIEQLVKDQIELHRILGLSVAGLRTISFGAEAKTNSPFGPPVRLFTSNRELVQKLRGTPSVSQEFREIPLGEPQQLRSDGRVVCFESDGCLCCYCLGM